MENLQYKRFADVNLNDPFFDSLKASYREFSDWFRIWFKEITALLFKHYRGRGTACMY